MPPCSPAASRTSHGRRGHRGLFGAAGLGSKPACIPGGPPGWGRPTGRSRACGPARSSKTGPAPLGGALHQAVHQALLDGHGFRHCPACACRANLAAAAASEPQLRASAPGLGSGPRLRASAPWLSLGTLAAFAFAAAGADRQCGIVTRQAAGRRRRAPGIPTSPGAPWRLESGPD